MKVNSIKLTNFRNHSKAEFGFDENISIIVGKNGSGKTNILEAIFLLTGNRSPWVKFDRDLISFGKQFCTVTSKIENEGDINDVEIQVLTSNINLNASSKKIKVNKVPKRSGVLKEYFSAILFTPRDIETITGTPSLRRKYIDSILQQSDTRYKKDLDTYTKAVKRRNKILEQISETGVGHNQLTFWTDKIVETGTYIQKVRQEYVAYLNKKIGTKVETHGNSLSIGYIKNEISTERLEKHKETEIFARTTLVGPHRDDYEIKIADRNISEFGSRGQQREAILAANMCEIDFLEEKVHHKPTLLLDDVFSEFDDDHKAGIVKLTKEYQTIITCTEIPSFINTANIRVINL